MKINTGVKAGGWDLKSTKTNHNEKLESEEKSRSSKTLKTKLRLNKETIRELKSSDLKRVAGGLAPGSGNTNCISDLLPTRCG